MKVLDLNNHKSESSIRDEIKDTNIPREKGKQTGIEGKKTFLSNHFAKIERITLRGIFSYPDNRARK